MNQTWRLLSGAVLGLLSVGVISICLSPGSGELRKQTELFLLLALWALTTGATLGALIYHDLRLSLREPRTDLTPGEPQENELRSDNNV